VKALAKLIPNASHLLNVPQIMKDKLNLSRGRDRDSTARQVCVYYSNITFHRNYLNCFIIS
jgi:hypothetical protein